MSAVSVTRLELSPAELRRAAAASRDPRAARRVLAIALVLEGRSRTEAAETCGMDRQTLRDWVHRYNAEGLSGLIPAVKPFDRWYAWSVDTCCNAWNARVAKTGRIASITTRDWAAGNQ